MMNDNLNPEREGLRGEDRELDVRLRPASFGDFAGQAKVIENLEVFVTAANRRGEALDHVYFMVLQVWERPH